MGDKVKSELIIILKALLMLILKERKGAHPYDHSLRPECDQLFDLMVDDCVSFCNDVANMRLIELMVNLSRYCLSSDARGRRRPLANMLNVILKEFANKEYGPIPRPSSHENKEEVIFLPNDPVIISSEHLEEYVEKTYELEGAVVKCSPDVVGVFLSHLCEKYENLGFSAMTEAIQVGDIPKEAGKHASTGWKNVHVTCELEWKGTLGMPEYREWTKTETLGKFAPGAENMDVETTKSSTSSTKESGSQDEQKPAADDTLKGKGKSRCDDEESSSSECSSTASSSAACNTGRRSTRRLISLNKQCKYYVAERLSASFVMTHAVVFAVSDASFSLRYHDPQGTIHCYAFDFIERLPLFVLTIMILQRFTHKLWGFSQRDDKKIKIGGKTYLIGEPTQQSFCLNGGRQGFFAPATLVKE